MSNIFDALRRSGPQTTGIDLPSLLDDDHQPIVEAPVKAAAPVAIPVPAATPAPAAIPVTPAPVVPEHSNGFGAGTSVKTGFIQTRPMSISVAGPILPFDSNRATIDQYRMLRTKIQQHPAQPRVLLVSGSGPGDGKTTTAINLAGALSLKPHTTVALVDTDLRRSSIRKTLGLETGPGLVEALTGTATLEQGLIRTEQYPSMYVLGSAEYTPGSAELLDSPRWIAILESLRKEFSYVVLDSPPIGSLADYDLLQACADGVILVVRPDHTRRDLAMKAINSIPAEKFLGVVINCVERWFLKKDYYYSHEYYGPSASDGQD